MLTIDDQLMEQSELELDLKFQDRGIEIFMEFWREWVKNDYSDELCICTDPRPGVYSKQIEY